MLRFKSFSVLILVSIIAIVFSHLFFSFGFIWIIIPIIIWLVVVSIGSFSMSSNFFLDAITNVELEASKKIAITFDDGPNAEYTSQVLQLLEKHNAKATFFVIGKHVKAYPEILKRIDIDGHQIGNHSYSHHNFIGFSSTKKWKSEITTTTTLIKNIIGKETAIFRPPFGVTTPNLAKAVKDLQLKVIGWNIRSYDTVIKNHDTVLNRIKKDLKSGSIILLHDTQANTLYVLEHLLLYLKQNNFEAVTINNLLNDI